MLRFERSEHRSFWYNVNGSGTGNRTYTFNVENMGIGLNRLDGPDGLAEEGRWRHLVAVMSGQQRSIYQNGPFGSPSLGF